MAASKSDKPTQQAWGNARWALQGASNELTIDIQGNGN